MRRRQFIALLSSTALVPSAGRGQQPMRVPLVAILSDWSPVSATKFMEPFTRGLRDLGYIEGQNITFESRHAAERYEILPSLATELASLQPQVILAVGTPAAQAAKSATQTIPIVFTRVGDPIGAVSRRFACAARRQSHGG